MSISEDMLAAYADGALDAKDRRRVEAAAAADAAVAERLAAHQNLAGRLRAAYEPVLEEPVPAALLAAASRPSPGRATMRWPAWAAMAACLLVGLAVGRMSLQQPVVGADMIARGRLDRALDTQLASMPADGVRIGVTFQNRGGGYCRTFQAEGLAGLACREDDAWRVEALAPASPADAGPFRTASSLPPAIAAAVDGRIAADALDADAERRARDADWRTAP